MVKEWKLDKWWKKLFYGVGWIMVVLSGPFMWLITAIIYWSRNETIKSKQEKLVYGYQKFVYVFGTIYALFIALMTIFVLYSFLTF